MRLVLIIALLAITGCDRGAGVRVLRIENLPSCPRGARYGERVIVRLDREPMLFAHGYSQSQTFDSPTAAATLAVRRARMKGVVRVGVCPPTSLGTSDCKAARWIAEQPFSLDDRGVTVALHVPDAAVACVAIR